MVRRSGTYLLSGVIALACGCAKPLPPPYSRIIEPQGFVHRFSSAPRVVVEDQPTQPFRQSAEERQALEKAREEFNSAREERVSQIADHRMSTDPGNNFGLITVQCVLATFIIFSPLCILIVPVAYGATSAATGRRVSRTEPYMPPVPSEQELTAVHETIVNHVTTAGIASRLGDTSRVPDASSAPQFPRLVITSSGVTFTAERTFVIKFLVRGHPSAEVSWPQTEHGYEFGYYHARQPLLSELRLGEARLAESISATYGLWAYGAPERRTVPNTAPPPGPRYSQAYVPSKPGSSSAPAGVIEQEPPLAGHGCAPFNAYLGSTYYRADGSRVAIMRILGESPACTGARPLAVEVQPY